MSKVTSKYQISIPKALADRAGIRVGDDLAWEEVDGDGGLRLRPATEAARALPTEERLALFDDATSRQRKRQRNDARQASKSRGWTRQDLYSR